MKNSLWLTASKDSKAFSISSMGFFGEPNGKNREEFRLTGLNEDSPYADKTYADLQRHNPVAFRKLNDTVLRSFIVKQLKPKGDTSIYHVFERLNTGGTSLAGQEIRNCVYHGPFNDMLMKLNSRPARKGKSRDDSKDAVSQWREILGRPKAISDSGTWN